MRGYSPKPLTLTVLEKELAITFPTREPVRSNMGVNWKLGAMSWGACSVRLNERRLRSEWN